MFRKCDHWDYDNKRMYNIRRHVKNEHEYHPPNNKIKQIISNISFISSNSAHLIQYYIGSLQCMQCTCQQRVANFLVSILQCSDAHWANLARHVGFQRSFKWQPFSCENFCQDHVIPP